MAQVDLEQVQKTVSSSANAVAGVSTKSIDDMLRLGRHAGEMLKTLKTLQDKDATLTAGTTEGQSETAQTQTSQTKSTQYSSPRPAPAASGVVHLKLNGLDGVKEDLNLIHGNLHIEGNNARLEFNPNVPRLVRQSTIMYALDQLEKLGMQSINQPAPGSETHVALAAANEERLDAGKQAIKVIEATPELTQESAPSQTYTAAPEPASFATTPRMTMFGRSGG